MTFLERVRRALGLERAPDPAAAPPLHEDPGLARALARVGWGLLGVGTLLLAAWRVLAAA